MKAKAKRRVHPADKLSDVSNNLLSQQYGFCDPLPRDHHESLFSRSLKGSSKDFELLKESEKKILFDYAMRMTGDINRSLDAIHEQFAQLNISHLSQCGSAFVFRQTLLLGLRDQLRSIWHRNTERLENAAYCSFMSPETENLKAIARPEKSPAYEFDREFHQLPGMEREALWLRGRLQASLDEIAQMMSLNISDVERHLVHALFRLENKSYGLDPENLVAHLPFHPLPAPESQVMTELSQVMRGIEKSQKAPRSFSRLIVLFLTITAGIYFFWMFGLYRSTQRIVADFFRNLGVTSQETLISD